MLGEVEVVMGAREGELEADGSGGERVGMVLFGGRRGSMVLELAPE